MMVLVMMLMIVIVVLMVSLVHGIDLVPRVESCDKGEGFVVSPYPPPSDQDIVLTEKY